SGRVPTTNSCLRCMRATPLWMMLDAPPPTLAVRVEAYRDVGTPYAMPANMAQSIWTGSIGFGLVQIPVSLHGAEERHELDMTLLDKSDLSPVGYKRFNKTTEREVQWDDIVKGYEHAKGEYVILTPADFEQANLKATKQV